MEVSGKYTKRVLTHPELGSVPRSMPLIIPNDCSYVVSTNELKPIQGERRSSLKVVPETLRLLESINRPVAVLAIGGPCRTGKSYILSRALGSADDFALGHTMNAQTFGIWIGTTVLEKDEFTVLMMDTEGIDSANAKARDDASILVMTVLLSSYFIYNSLGSPKKNDLQKMSHFAKLASSIAIQSASASEEDEDEAFEMKKYFPDFLWLLRDVVLQIPDGKTPTDYLKTTILKRGRSFTESASDTVSRAILTFFPTITCMTIQPPSADPSVMQDIVTKQKSLEPRFNEQVEDVVQYVLQNLQAKNGFTEGKVVDGPLLAAMTEQYVQAVNDPNAIPCINDTWQAAVEARCRKVLEELVQEYEDEMKKKIAEVGLPMEEDSQDGSDSKTLFGLHRSILFSKTQALMKQVGHFLGVPSQATPTSSTGLTLDSLIAELEHSTAVFEEKESLSTVVPIKGESQQITKKVVCGGILLKFAKSNHQMSRSQCQDLFSQLYKGIEMKIKQEDVKYTFKDLSVDLQALLEQYNKCAVGPAKWEVYEEKRAFIKSQEESYKRLQGWKKEKFETLQKLEEEKAKSAKRDEELKKVIEQMRNDTKMAQQKMQAMQDAHQKEMEKIRDQQEKRIEAERQKSEDFMKAQMKEMAEITKENKKEMEKQHELMVQQMKMMSEQNSASIQAINASIAAMTEAIQNMPSGGGGCFVAGTMVKLSNGKEIAIEKQTEGVKILAMGGETSTITAEYVDHTLKPQDRIFSFNDDAPFAALHHPFWTTEGWKCLDPDTAKEENPDVDFKLLQVGDIVFRVAQTDPLLYEPVKVHRINFTTLTEPTKIYGLHLDGPRSYHANGYIVAANYPVLTKKRVRDGMKKLTEEERESLKSALTSAKRELTTVLGSWAEDAFVDMGLTKEQL